MPPTELQNRLIKGQDLHVNLNFASLPQPTQWQSMVVVVFRNVVSESASVMRANLLTKLKVVEPTVLRPVSTGGCVTDPESVKNALLRYHTAAPTHSSGSDFDNALLGSLLVDIYALTGKYQRTILRDEHRTDKDCALFPLYRAVHWVAADLFGRMHHVPPDQIDIFLQRQTIGISDHGKYCDSGVQAMQVGGQSVLRYLKDEEALACRLHVRNGKLYVVTTPLGTLAPFDTTGDDWKKIGGNTCHVGFEDNGGKGVAGFAMAISRDLFAFKHSYDETLAGGAFFHSGYLEGRPVICTGCLTAEAGRLTYINNFSGHYQPSPAQLQLVLDSLRALGLPVENAAVQLMLENGDMPTYTGLQFLNNPNLRAKAFDPNADGRVTGKAGRIREALAAYDARSKKWYSRPSPKSLRILDHLKDLREDEILVAEVRFCVGVKKAKSPLGTAETLDDGELKKQLVKALG